jgi:hypothetical protein
MKKPIEKSVVPVEIIQNKIYMIRGLKFMLDRDLADLYGVPTSQLTRQVRRNIERFPMDFLIELTREELNNLICQIGTSSWGGTRKLPMCFTEQGIAMLSGVLHGPRAVQVNIQIMRVFTKLRQMIDSYKELRVKVEEMEKKYDSKFENVFAAIRQLMSAPLPKVDPKPEEKPNDDYKRTKVGFIVENKRTA